MNKTKLAIPKESGVPMFSLLFDILMLLTFLVYIQYANGKMGIVATTPASGSNGMYIFFSFLCFSVPIFMFLCTICFAKKNPYFLLLPLAITPISYLLYELYSLVNGDGGFVIRQWYKVVSSIYIFIVFYLMLKGTGTKMKRILIISCLVLIGIAVGMTAAEVGPFTEKIPAFLDNEQYYPATTIIYMSSLLQYVCYLAAVVSLGVAFTPGGVYKQKQSRSFFALRNMDRIHEINRTHGMRR